MAPDQVRGRQVEMPVLTPRGIPGQLNGAHAAQAEPGSAGGMALASPSLNPHPELAEGLTMTAVHFGASFDKLRVRRGEKLIPAHKPLCQDTIPFLEAAQLVDEQGAARKCFLRRRWSLCSRPRHPRQLVPNTKAEGVNAFFSKKGRWPKTKTFGVRLKLNCPA